MKLLTLGELTLEGSDFTRPKPLLLLTYLQFEGAKSRREVAELFWANNTDPLKMLRVVMAQINKEVDSAIKTDTNNNKVWTELPSDVLELRETLIQGQKARAIELYKGPFLAGFDLSDIGEELGEWVYQTRERIAHDIRQALLGLAENAAGQANYKEGANYAEKAYFLRSAPEPNSETLEQIYTFLKAGESQHAESVAKEAGNYGLELSFTIEQARSKLQPELSKTLEILASNQNSPSQAEDIQAQSNTLNQQNKYIAQQVKPLILRSSDKFKFLFFSSLIAIMLAVLSYLLLTASFSSKEVNLGPDDVDVSLTAYYFCNTHQFLFLSSTYDSQSTAIRFRDTLIPQTTPTSGVLIKSATLTFMASKTLDSIPTPAGFTIRGIFDSSPWLVPDPNECKLDPVEAQNYINRPRTSQLVTYHPKSWVAGQIYTIDVTKIVQEMVNSSDWTGGAFAFAMDSAKDSWVDLDAFSFDRNEKNVAKRPKISINYTTEKSP
jgi:DNA-binding SARP family transcriptional activator